jgi:putative transposase
MSYNQAITQSISVKCKLIVHQELRREIDRTLEGFADACNQILTTAKDAKCWNVTKLHHLVYHPVRLSTGLKANHVCQAIRRVVGNAKAVKQIHCLVRSNGEETSPSRIRKFRPSSISLDARTFKYDESKQIAGITLIGGRVNLPLKIGGYQIALLRGQTPTSATLNKTRQGDYFINIVVEIESEPTGKTPKVIGVDSERGKPTQHS